MLKMVLENDIENSYFKTAITVMGNFVMNILYCEIGAC